MNLQLYSIIIFYRYLLNIVLYAFMMDPHVVDEELCDAAA